MNDHGWRKIVRIGVAALIIILLIRIGGDFIVSVVDGSYQGKGLGEILSDLIVGALDWIVDVIQYAFFGRGWY